MRRFTAAVLVTFSLLASGCSVVDAVHGPDRPASIVGASLQDLDPSVGMFFHDGQLIIANDGQIEGIAVVDTGTEIVTGFHAIGKTIREMIHDPDHDAAYVSFEYGSGGYGLYRLDLATQKLTRTSGWQPQFWDRFSVSAGEVFASGPPDSYTNPPADAHLTWLGVNHGNLNANAMITTEQYRDIAVAGGKLYILGSPGAALLAYPLQTPLVRDTVNIDLDGAIDRFGSLATPRTATRLVGWGDRLIIIVESQSAGSLALVLNTVSDSVTGAVPLEFRGYHGPQRILNDTLYALSSGRYNFTLGPEDESDRLVGGVEAIDLRTRTHLGVLATESNLGVTFIDFAPTGGKGGYIAVQSASPPYFRKVARPNLSP